MSERRPSPVKYRAPALEKGLDILELLATTSNGLSQSRIAAKLGRTHGEIFRMLEVLRERGYIRRQDSGDAYQLTPRMFVLSHRHPPIERLQEAALPIMRALAEATGQSCHLAVLYQFSILVIAQIDSPLAMGYSVRVGSRHPVLETASGRILLSTMTRDVWERWIASARERGVKPSALAALSRQLARMRRLGFERRASTQIKGVTDLSCPVLSSTREALAALTIPSIAPRERDYDEEDVLALLKRAARRISRELGA